MTVLIIVTNMNQTGGGVATVTRQLWSSLHLNENIFLYESDNSQLHHEKTLFEMRLSHAVKKIQPSVVHIHGIWHPAILYFIFLHPNMRLIISPHGMLNPWAVKKKRFVKHLLLRLYGSRSKNLRLVALTKEERDHICSHFRSDQVVIVPNPIELHADAGIPKNRTKEIVSFGRICRQKNSYEFVSEIKKIEKLGIFVPRIDIFGWSDDLSYHDRVVGIISETNAIKFNGALEHKNVPSIISGYKFFCIYSNFEGFPMAALEALSLGCIVIGNQTSGLQEISTSPNVYIITGDIDEFVTGLLCLIRQRPTYDGNDTTLQQFKTEHVCRKLQLEYGI